MAAFTGLLMYVFDSELFLQSPEGQFGVHFRKCKAAREIIIKIIFQWLHKRFNTGGGGGGGGRHVIFISYAT